MLDFAKTVQQAEPGKTHLFSAGQAGFVIKSKSGQTLAIDLYLSECGERLEGNDGFKRLLPLMLQPEEMAFDVIIATHPHFDHFDPDAMKGLMDNGKSVLFASVNCEKWVKILGIGDKERVHYMIPGDKQTIGDYEIDFINCDHGTGAPDAFGVIITVDGIKICEAGDTCLRLDRVEEYNSKGQLDILIGPINGAYGNMNETDFAKLCGAVKPKLAIPCHYGMFASHGGNPGIFREEMKKNNPDVSYMLMRMGEQFTFKNN